MIPKYKTQEEFMEDLSIFLMKLQYTRDSNAAGKYNAQTKALVVGYIEQVRQDERGKYLPKPPQWIPESKCGQHSWRSTSTCTSYFIRQCAYCGKEETIDKD